jgi:hypothetical protein
MNEFEQRVFQILNHPEMNVQEMGFAFAEFVAFVMGLKPVILLHVDRKRMKSFHALCKLLDLKYAFPETEKKKWFSYSDGYACVMISKSEKYLKRAVELWNYQFDSSMDPDREIEWANLLGYPTCCTKSFFKWRHKYVGLKKWDGDRVVSNSYRGTKNKRNLPFYSNNVFNFSSTIDGETSLVERKKFLSFCNRVKFPVAAPSLIGWHPCSYDCRQSIARAKKLYEFLKRVFPDKAQCLREICSKPVVYLDRYQFFCLQGAASKRVDSGLEISFGDIVWPFYPISSKIVSKIRKAKKMIIREEWILDEKGNRLLKSIYSRPILFLNFNADE